VDSFDPVTANWDIFRKQDQDFLIALPVARGLRYSNAQRVGLAKHIFFRLRVQYATV